MLSTIELILGLPPMSQYDASAPSLWQCFNDSATHPAFSVRACQQDLDEINSTENEWSKISENFDFNKEDRAPDGLFNEVIWCSVKGFDSPCPPPVHAAFLKINIEEDL